MNAAPVIAASPCPCPRVHEGRTCDEDARMRRWEWVLQHDPPEASTYQKPVPPPRGPWEDDETWRSRM